MKDMYNYENIEQGSSWKLQFWKHYQGPWLLIKETFEQDSGGSEKVSFVDGLLKDREQRA